MITRLARETLALAALSAAIIVFIAIIERVF